MLVGQLPCVTWTAQLSWMFVRAPILNVVDVSADDRPEPDRRVVADLDVADDRRVRGDVDPRPEPGIDAFVQGVSHKGCEFSRKGWR